MELKKEKPLPNRVLLTDLLHNSGISLFVEGLKNNVELWNEADAKKFYQMLLIET